MDYFRGKRDEILYIYLSLSIARPFLLITMDPGLTHLPRGLDYRNHYALKIVHSLNVHIVHN